MIAISLSAADILHEEGIRTKSSAAGRYSTTCPQCSHTRRKSRDRCLGVTIDNEGVGWRCFHCDWSGGRFYSFSRQTIRRMSVPQPAMRSNDEAKRSRLALTIWREAQDPRGTIVSDYLASRGLTLPDDVAGKVIRFHPSLCFNGAYVGGMVVLFRDSETDEPCGIHRIFLDSQVRKLDRWMLGRVKGAAVKLDADENVSLGLHIGEGVETCIAAQLAGFRPVWALGSANAIKTFPVLPGIEAITVLGEVGDGGANQKAAQACAARWIEAGQDAFVVEPLVGEDLNAVWREVAA